MAVALGANVIGFAICILFNAILVCHSVSADSFEAVKLAGHLADVYQWEVRHCITFQGLSYSQRLAAATANCQDISFSILANVKPSLPLMPRYNLLRLFLCLVK